MKNTWIVVANGSRGRILTTDTPRNMKHDDDLQELSCFEHPESRQKMIELTADVYGRHAQGAGRGPGSSDFVEKSDVREQEKIAFAKEMMQTVKKAIDNKSCASVILVMPPKFYGHFKSIFPESMHNHVFMHIGKDYTTLNKHELRVQLQPHLSLGE